MHRLMIAIGPLAVALAACGSGSTDVVAYTDPNKLSLVNLPTEWHTYEIAELNALEDVPFAEPYQGFEYPAVSSVAFDGAPARDVANVTNSLAVVDFPIGAMSVRTVGEIERQYLNRAALSQSVLPYFEYLDYQEHAREDFSFGDGYDGVRVLVSYVDESGAEVGIAYLISVTDPADNRMYSIVAGCSRDCYIANQAEIERVVDSWLVNKKAS
ncbi:MAG TPA: hypothetical protein VJQ79_15085 [Acidimicrobiia bacterium]|nr:hypothetical protein [Acidimicrobiia bacterium]